MSKRIRAAEKQVIAEARVIHRNGWGNGTTYGLGEAFRELGEAEQEQRKCDCAACKGEAGHEGCADSGCNCPCLKTGGVAE